MIASALAAALLAVTSDPSMAAREAEPKVLRVDLRAFQVVKDDSGPVNYYRVASEDGGEFIRAEYAPPMETTVLGWAMPDHLRRSAARVRWRWRAVTLPVGGNECVSGKNDSAAVVYLTFKRGLRWYALKYVWSSVGPRRATCDKRRNIVRAQDTIIAETGGPVNVWRTVELDPEAEFRRHFDTGNGGSERPEFMGLGIMTDGDQTQSKSAADFADFVVTLR